MSDVTAPSAELRIDDVKEIVSRPMWTIFSRYARPHWKLFVISVTSRLFRFMTFPVNYFLIGVAFDTIFLPDEPFRLPLVPAAWIPETQLGQIWFVFWIIIALTLIGAVRMVVSHLSTAIFSQRIQHDVRTDVYDTTQRLELAFFDANQTGEVMSVLNDDVRELGNFVSGGLEQVLQTIGHLGGLIILMALINWQLMLVTLAVAPIIVYLNLRFSGLIGEVHADIRSTVAALNARLQNNISGIGVIKAYGTEDFERDRVTDASMDFRESRLHAVKVVARYYPSMSVLTGIAYLVTFVIGGYWVIVGPPLFFTVGLTPGGLITFLLYTSRVQWPISQATRVIDSYKSAQAAAARVVGLESANIRLTESNDPVPLDDVRGAVEYDDVTFTYASRSDPAVQDIDITVAPGEVIGLVGPTGAGKSTLLKLLLRLYDVDSGRVRIDGVDVRDVSLADLRAATGYVSQDPFLFSGTVRENIAYGDPTIELPDIVEAAKLAGAHEFIHDLPAGYETEVGERGVKLSGGQRQRVAIARAFLRDPPILVMDEATSHVDNETEAKIQRGIESLIQGRTAFVIAHRLSTVQQADRIIVMDEGRIVERGTHEELLAREGLYANLWHVQVGEVEALPGEFLQRIEELDARDVE